MRKEWKFTFKSRILSELLTDGVKSYQLNIPNIGLVILKDSNFSLKYAKIIRETNTRFKAMVWWIDTDKIEICTSFPYNTMNRPLQYISIHLNEENNKIHIETNWDIFSDNGAFYVAQGLYKYTSIYKTFFKTINDNFKNLEEIPNEVCSNIMKYMSIMEFCENIKVNKRVFV
jgi:hypothetical protein